MRTLPAILLVLAAARAEAWPENVYVAQSDGSISVLDGGGLTTNHTPRPFPTNLCRATDGAADPGGGVVWFVTRWRWASPGTSCERTTRCSRPNA